MQKHVASSDGLSALSDVSGRVVAAIAAYKDRGSLRDFSAASGIPYPSLLEYASGKKKPGLEALAAIVQASGVSPAWLLTGEGEMRQHRATTKTVHADGKLLSRAATELELAWVRVKEQGRDAVAAALEALPLDDQKYRKLVAKESGAAPGEIESRIERVVYMAVLATTIYNLFADIKDEEERNRKVREQAYELLTYTRAPQRTVGRDDVEGGVAPSGTRKPVHERRRKPKTRLVR